MRLPCLARRWNSRKSGWIMESVHGSDRVPEMLGAGRNLRSIVFGSRKKRPIITLLQAGRIIRQRPKVLWTAKEGKRRQAAALPKGFLVNHNRPTPPMLFVSVDFKDS